MTLLHTGLLCWSYSKDGYKSQMSRLSGNWESSLHINLDKLDHAVGTNKPDISVVYSNKVFISSSQNVQSCWAALHFVVAPPSDTWDLSGSVTKGREGSKRY